MKPFMIKYLKCITCESTTDFNLKVTKCAKIDYQFTEFLNSQKDFFLKDDAKNLKKLCKELENREEAYNLIEEEILAMLEDRELEKMAMLLFGNDVMEGELLCGECNRAYSIKEGIPRMMDDHSSQL